MKLGYVNTRLDRAGNPSIIPFPTVKPNEGDIVPVTAATVTFKSAVKIVETIAPLAKREEVEEVAVKEELEDAEVTKEMVPEFFDAHHDLHKRQNVGNIFTPISTAYPPLPFTRRRTHPVPPKGIVDSGVPLHTNVC